MGAYRAGNVALANAVGNGVADDKAIYAYVPEFIRYYLGEEPLLRTVETYICAKPEDLSYVLDHLPELVVKLWANRGYGMLTGPRLSTARELKSFATGSAPIPGTTLHKPVVALMRLLTTQRTRRGQHVDLRPYCLYDGEKATIVPGGLTVWHFSAVRCGERRSGRRQQRHVGTAEED